MKFNTFPRSEADRSHPPKSCSSSAVQARVSLKLMQHVDSAREAFNPAAIPTNANISPWDGGMPCTRMDVQRRSNNSNNDTVSLQKTNKRTGGDRGGAETEVERHFEPTIQDVLQRTDQCNIVLIERVADSYISP